jgi:hypothetical protein
MAIERGLEIKKGYWYHRKKEIAEQLNSDKVESPL